MEGHDDHGQHQLFQVLVQMDRKHQFQQVLTRIFQENWL